MAKGRGWVLVELVEGAAALDRLVATFDGDVEDHIAKVTNGVGATGAVPGAVRPQ